MSDWEPATIGSHIQIERGFAFRSGDYENEGHFILRVSNLSGDGNVTSVGGVFLKDRLVPIYSNYQLDEGDILLVMVGATTGKIGLVPKDVLPALLNQNLWNLKPKSDSLHKPFFYFILKEIIERFLASSQGSARDFLKQSDFEKVDFMLPPPPEQRKIARILTTVDNLIEQTEALIAKYQSIKQGMMHDLFTRGVDSSGQLRPTHKQAPDLYKKSELGWIPKEWEAKTLIDVVSPSRPIVYGILMPGYGFEGGIPVIKVKDIKYGIVQEANLLLTDPEIDRKYTRSKTQPGDLLFTIRGTVGRTAFVPESLDGANITQDTARIGIITGDPRFIRGYLGMPEPARFIACNTLGVAVQGINLGDVRQIPIAFPPEDEQVKIGDIAESNGKKIDAETTHLKKLRTTKSGLMQDLLTGKVRVNVE